MQATQDKTKDERRRRRHEHAAGNRENNSAYLCPTCSRTCPSRIGLYSHEQPTSKDKMMDRIRRFDVHRRERDWCGCTSH